MAPAQGNELLAEAVDEEAQVAAELLRQHAGDSRVAYGLAAVLAHRAEAAVAKARQSGPRRALPVCQPSCDSCCIGVRVDVFAPEAFLIVAALERTLDAKARDRVLGRVIEAAGRARGLDALSHAKAALECPLLDPETRLCSAYAARPLGCRGHSSYDRTACEGACRSPNLAARVPRDENLYTIFTLSRVALAKSLVEAGLDARPLELSQALLIAIQTDGGEARWLGGEPLFESAVVSTLEHDASALESANRLRT